jgi:hypothetical protein
MYFNVEYAYFVEMQLLTSRCSSASAVSDYELDGRGSIPGRGFFL